MSQLVIEPLLPEDREACLDLAQRVGWPREHAKWDVFFEVGEGFGTRGEHGALTSMVMLPQHEGVTFVAMMVVDPSMQGRGLGHALLSHALTRGKPPAMLYATPAGQPLYQRLGFVEVHAVRKFIGKARPAPDRGAVREAGATDLQAVVAADAQAFGAARTRMLRALSARAERLVLDDDGGFALRWFNGHVRVIGPVVAQDEAAAIRLIDAARIQVEGEVRIDVPVSSPAVAKHVAEAIGLQELEGAPLMRWPDALLAGERRRYHAIALQGLG